MKGRFWVDRLTLIDPVVEGRDIVIADRPVNADPVAQKGLEVIGAPARHVAAPVIAAGSALASDDNVGGGGSWIEAHGFSATALAAIGRSLMFRNATGSP